MFFHQLVFSLYRIPGDVLWGGNAVVDHLEHIGVGGQCEHGHDHPFYPRCLHEFVAAVPQMLQEVPVKLGLSVLLGLVKTGTVEVSGIIIIILKVSAFFGFTILAGHFLVPFFTRKLDDYNAKGFTFAMISALVMATAAELAGLHTVIGAFLAGQFVRKEIMHEKIYNAISDRFYGLSHGFLMPVFFVSLAFHIHFKWDISFLLFAAAITITAILGKLVGCGLGALSFRYSMRESSVIGFGMNGRGAVELVVVAVVLALSNDLLAQGVLSEPLLTEDQFSALVLMAFVTTLLAPLMLRWSVMKTCSGSEKEQFCQLWTDKRKK